MRQILLVLLVGGENEPNMESREGEGGIENKQGGAQFFFTFLGSIFQQRRRFQLAHRKIGPQNEPVCI
jgi:hypothetical protein